MNQTRLWVVASIIASVILVVFLFSIPRSTKAPTTKTFQQIATTTPSVAINDSFKKGLHTITGTIEVSNACSTVTENSSLVGEASSTQSILVDISKTEDSGICLQRVATIHFSTTVTAPARLPIILKINGVVASTTDL